MNNATEPPKCGLHQWLREQTQALHHQLDHAPLLRALLSDTLNAQTYGQCLNKLRLAHARTEPWLTQLDYARPSALPPYESRLPAFDNDLLALAQHYPPTTPTPSNETSHALPAALLPGHVHPASLYTGIRYVLEGASLGGDEFAIVLNGVKQTDDIQALGERIIDAISQPYELEQGRVNISASVGAAILKPGHNLETALHNADMAMYRIKRSGRNGYALHS